MISTASAHLPTVVGPKLNSEFPVFLATSYLQGYLRDTVGGRVSMVNSRIREEPRFQNTDALERNSLKESWLRKTNTRGRFAAGNYPSGSPLLHRQTTLNDGNARPRWQQIELSEWHRVADGQQTVFTTVTSSSWSLSTPCTIATTVAQSSGTLWLSTLASTNSTVRPCIQHGRSVGPLRCAHGYIHAHMQMLFGCAVAESAWIQSIRTSTGR